MRASVIGRTEADVLRRAKQLAARFYVCPVEEIALGGLHCELDEMIETTTAAGGVASFDATYRLEFSAWRVR